MGAEGINGNVVDISITDERAYYNRGFSQESIKEKNTEKILREEVTEEMKQKALRKIDEYFLRTFLTGELFDEILMIGNDFLKHHMSELPEYASFSWSYLDVPDKNNAEMALRIKILNLIYSAAKSGDSYSTALMKYLYQKYYKKEYQVLKRYSSITEGELIEMQKSTDGDAGFFTRVLAMCQVLKIQKKGSFGIIYHVFAEDDEKEECLVTEDDVNDSMEVILRCQRRAEKEDTDRYAIFREISEFIDQCLMYRGTEKLNLQHSLENAQYMQGTFAVTHAVLKKMYPDKRISFRMVQRYAVYYAMIRKMMGTRYVLNQDTGILFGIWNQLYDYDHKEPFRLEDHVHLPHVVESKAEKKEENSIDRDQQTEELKKCKQENEEFCKRIKSLTNENKDLRAQLSKDKKLKEQMQKLQEEREADKAELIALRDFAYSQSMEYEPAAGISMDQMEEELRKHKIMIVGGHISWQNKLKQMFPGWILIAPQTYLQFNPKMYEGLEKVYFYTNYINHSTQRKFMDEIKAKKIPFGYLNQVNLEHIISKVYYDMNS